MNRTLLLALFLIGILADTALAQRVRVRSYVRKSTGTYTTPHYRTSPNSSRTDNWSTKGNSNPYTGKKGTKDPYAYHNYRR